MEKRFSNKITNINFLISVIIVLIHSSCYRFLNVKEQLSFISIHNLIFTIYSIAVPTFFCISGYFLYRNLTINNIKQKLSRRVKSLLIPYLLWNLLFFIYYKTISIIPVISNFANIHIDVSIKNFLINYFWNGFFHTSWFIRNIIIYTVLCPIILTLLNICKKKIIPILFLIVSFMIPIFIEFRYSSVFYWFPIYYLGALFGHYYSEIIEKNNTKNIKVFLSSFLFLIILIIIFKQFDYYNHYMLYIFRMIVPIPFYIYISSFDFIYQKPKKITSISFFLTIIHVLFIQIINKIQMKLFGISILKIIVYSLSSTVITIAITYILYVILKRTCPKLFSIMLGGRLKNG